MRDGLLYVSKWCGLFRLARFLTRRGIRILCYHGFGAGDELRFRPGLFIAPSIFRKRLETLRAQRYPVIALGAALERLRRGDLPTCTTVITVDDTFYSFYVHGAPLLRQFRMPATAYVTTYYSEKRHPVFRLAVQYMFWKSSRASIDLGELHPVLRGVASLSDAVAKHEAAWRVISFAEAHLDEVERLRLAATIGRLLDVDFERLVTDRTFSIVTAEEIATLARSGVDIQLHTHRHRLPLTREEVSREIEQNRRVLRPLVGAPLVHFCYPSGLWSPVAWPWLRELGVVSATTCDAGFNYPDTPRLALKRILDADDVSQVAFEAEITGFKQLLRECRAWLARPLAMATTNRRRGSPNQPPAAADALSRDRHPVGTGDADGRQTEQRNDGHRGSSAT